MTEGIVAFYVFLLVQGSSLFCWKNKMWLGGGFKHVLCFSPYLRKWSNLTNIMFFKRAETKVTNTLVEMHWNHQPPKWLFPHLVATSTTAIWRVGTQGLCTVRLGSEVDWSSRHCLLGKGGVFKSQYLGLCRFLGLKKTQRTTKHTLPQV